MLLASAFLKLFPPKPCHIVCHIDAAAVTLTAYVLIDYAPVFFLSRTVTEGRFCPLTLFSAVRGRLT